MSEPLEGRLETVRRRIASATDHPERVTIVAVTKGLPPDAVTSALRLGLRDVGENYAAELLAKAGVLGAGSTVSPADGVRWHFLGAVQRNKVARLAPVVSCWQGVSRIEEGRAIATRRPGAVVYVQVDLAGIPGRGGRPTDEIPALVGALRREGVDVAGLMAVGVPGPPEASRAGFRLVASLADELDLVGRSMGMSDDLEVAVAEGSTMVRIGRALFGERPTAA